MGIWTEYEIKQMNINRAEMPDTAHGKNLETKKRGLLLPNRQYIKIYDDHSNWVIYAETGKTYCFSVAKPESGASSSCFGNLFHVKSLYKEGRFKYKGFTKYGRRLLKI